MKLKIKISRHFGFTLVELLVVIAISGILASASYIGIQEVRKTIRDNKRRADLNELARALELFKADQGQYPPSVDLSADYSYGQPGHGDDRSLLPKLKDGGSMALAYKTANGGFTYKSVSFSGGYLKEYARDPINHVDLGYIGYMYAYYGPGLINSYEMTSFIDDINDFPMDCEYPDPGQCGTLGGTHEQTWGECCNPGGANPCLDRYCDFDDNNTPDQSDDSLTWFNISSNFGRFCYGPNSKRSMGLLLARLEKPSKPEERIDEVFAFCPTADPANPYHEEYFNFLKKVFPRGKECYNGNDTDDWNCDSVGWNGWALNYHNYFVPLTGEFNLR